MQIKGNIMSLFNAKVPSGANIGIWCYTVTLRTYPSVSPNYNY